MRRAIDRSNQSIKIWYSPNGFAIESERGESDAAFASGRIPM
jgi:hypothetical protein